MTHHSTEYNDCLNRMYGLRRFGILLGLETIGTVLTNLDNPQHRFRTIHIAGTNGKGSVAAALSTILVQAGHRVGRYTSPHLVEFNERICVNNVPVSDAAVVDSYWAVHHARSAKRDLTFFEYATAMAFQCFARESVEWAVIETGMGGRLDATNILRPDATIITNVSLDHQAYLGNRLRDIAGEKAGIIKPAVPVVTAVRQPVVREVVQATADAQRAPLWRLGQDFKIRRSRDGSFSYAGPVKHFKGLRTGLVGDHQIENAAVAIAACEALTEMRDVVIDGVAIRSGLVATRWPGRLEIVQTDPTVILDGAHNLAAVDRLAGHLRSQYASRPITLVIGVLDDKPWPEMLRRLAGLCRQVVITEAAIDRSVPSKTIVPEARRWCSRVVTEPTVPAAVNRAIAEADPEDVICVAGSLYVVGEAKGCLT